MPAPSPAPTHDPLQAYKAKRDFALTTEPAEGGQSLADQLTFVVQKHWASGLHYDLRLELDGVMKSWAVCAPTGMNRPQAAKLIHPPAFGCPPTKEFSCPV